MAVVMKKADRALKVTTLKAYLDFLCGELVFETSTQIDRTYDVIVNAILSDLTSAGMFSIAGVYTDAMIIAKDIYKRRLKDSGSRREAAVV